MPRGVPVCVLEGFTLYAYNSHLIKQQSKLVLYVRFKSYYLCSKNATRQFLASEMRRENICFEVTAPALWSVLLVAGMGIDTVSGPERYKRTPVLPGGLVVKLGEGPGRPSQKNRRHSDDARRHVLWTVAMKRFQI